MEYKKIELKPCPFCGGKQISKQKAIYRATQKLDLISQLSAESATLKFQEHTELRLQLE